MEKVNSNSVNKKQSGLNEKETYMKESVLDKFFSIEIHDLNRYMKNAKDKGDFKEAFADTKHDMGLFNKAQIRKYDDGSYIVIFWADRVELTDSLVEFVNTCVSLYGPTLTGEGVINNDDYQAVESGSFTRMWDKVGISISNDDENKPVMMLTLFRPKQIKLAAAPISNKRTKLNK